MTLENQVLPWDKHKNVTWCRVKQNLLMGSQNSPLDTMQLVSNDNTFPNDKKPAQILFHSKDHILLQK